MAEFSEPHSHNSLVQESCHAQRDNSNLGMQHGIRVLTDASLKTRMDWGSDVSCICAWTLEQAQKCRQDRVGPCPGLHSRQVPKFLSGVGLRVM